MKRISVIIVSWNTRELLKGCLNSIRTPGGSLVQEVIVVDNASADGSADMVATQFSDVILIRSKENLGFARANNLGIERASGSWLALVNSDVMVHPGCFEELVKYLETHGEVGLVGPAVVGADGRPQPTCRRLPTIWSTACRSLALDNVFSRWPILSGRELGHKGQAQPAEVGVLSGCFWVARREAVAQVGGLDERFFFYAEEYRLVQAVWGCRMESGFRAKGYRDAFRRWQFRECSAPLQHRDVAGQSCLLEETLRSAGPGGFLFLSILHHITRLPMRGVETVLGRGLDSAYKYQRSLVCLRWLLTGKGV